MYLLTTEITKASYCHTRMHYARNAMTAEMPRLCRGHRQVACMHILGCIAAFTHTVIFYAGFAAVITVLEIHKTHFGRFHKGSGVPSGIRGQILGRKSAKFLQKQKHFFLSKSMEFQLAVKEKPAVKHNIKKAYTNYATIHRSSKM